LILTSIDESQELSLGSMQPDLKARYYLRKKVPY
jgi:hypothetical protein